jgi:2-hydroxy-3-keto-5-methylthiopentenyl-1-phosphate phosphatase
MKPVNSLLTLLIFSFACSSPQKPLAPEYEAAVIRYFSDIHKINFDSGDNVVIVQLAGCDPCIKEVLQHLSTNQIDVNIVLAGSTFDDAINNYVTSLNTQYKIFWDKDYMLKKYRTSLIGPTWLEFGNDGLKRVEKLETENLKLILQ